MASNDSGRHAVSSITTGSRISHSPIRNDASQALVSIEKGYARLGRKGKTAGRRSSKRKPSRDTVGNRQWSDYEMQTVLALICKGVHLKKGGALSFATALNEALNGKRREHMDDDVEVEDVELLLQWLSKEKKGALAFVERQSARCITRVARRVFHKNLPFDGSKEEWQRMSPKSPETSNSSSLGNRGTGNPSEDRDSRTSGLHYSASSNRNLDTSVSYRAGRSDLYGPRPTESTSAYGPGWSSHPIGQTQQPHPTSIPSFNNPPPYNYYSDNTNYHHPGDSRDRRSLGTAGTYEASRVAAFPAAMQPGTGFGYSAHQSGPARPAAGQYYRSEATRINRRDDGFSSNRDSYY